MIRWVASSYYEDQHMSIHTQFQDTLPSVHPKIVFFHSVISMNSVQFHRTHVLIHTSCIDCGLSQRVSNFPHNSFTNYYIFSSFRLIRKWSNRRGNCFLLTIFGNCFELQCLQIWFSHRFPEFLTLMENYKGNQFEWYHFTVYLRQHLRKKCD